MSKRKEQETYQYKSSSEKKKCTLKKRNTEMLTILVSEERNSDSNFVF